MLITPVSERPPTTMNRPAKKPMVAHSTSSKIFSMSAALMISITAAAVSATVLGVTLNMLCVTNATATRTIITTLFLNRLWFWIASCACISMICACFSGEAFMLRPYIT